MPDCPEYISARIICSYCGYRWTAIYTCPIPPEQHARTPIPDARIACPQCSQTGARPEAYWNRLSQLPS